MKTWFVVFLLFGFYGTANVFGVDPTRVRVTRVIAPVPQTIFVPQIQVVPYEHVRTEVAPIVYPTPLRDLLFGRQRVTHVFSPQVTR